MPLDEQIAGARTMTPNVAPAYRNDGWTPRGVDRRANPVCYPAGTGMLARWQMDRLARYVVVHVGAKLSQAGLAAEVRLSVSHFARAFHRSFGITPHRYVTARRMDRARMLLACPDQKLSEIALICGLSDQAHLSRLFKQETGLTPSQWRRRYAKHA